MPRRLVGRIRDQLGSVRRVYLGRDLVNRRDDFADYPEVVLLLHGFFQTRNIWDVMEDRLRFDGYGVMSFNLAGPLWRFNTEPVDRTARLIGQKVEALAAEHGFERVHVIGHSKGGLIARRYIQRYGGARRVKSLTTLGTPHHGTPTAALALPVFAVGTSLRDLLPRSALIRELHDERVPRHIPLTSIYSRTDIICPWWCSVLRPAPDEEHLSNIEVPGVGHSELAWHPGVYREVRRCLDLASDAAPEGTAG